MTNYISLTFIAIGLAADAFAVSIGEGLKEVKIKNKEVIKKASVFALMQGLMPLIGWEVGKYFYNILSKYSSYITFSLLTIIGLKMIYDGVFIKNAQSQDKKSTNIWILAVITSIDALAIGFSFSMIPDFHIFSSIILISAVTFTLSVIGILLGRKAGHFVNFKTEYIGGAILILIGILNLF